MWRIMHTHILDGGYIHSGDKIVIKSFLTNLYLSIE